MSCKRLLLNMFLLFVGTAVGTGVYAQETKVSGKIIDEETQRPVRYVTVTATNVKDSLDQRMVSTDVSGSFVVSGLKKMGTYRLKATRMGYADVIRSVEFKNAPLDLGILVLPKKVEVLQEVVVVAQAPPAVQKGDTTELNAGAFKTNPDATAEDLLKKLPGLEVDNSGNVKAHGEDVKKVLVDGKPFFGDDPTVALKNLPAEVIDKVQVYNKMSEQAEFTGFDDGNSSKTINIVTKANRRQGVFGKVYAGSDFTDKYLAGGNLNIFKGTSRISVIGLLNNVNQQNFAMQDVLGISGGGGGGGRGGGGGGGRSGGGYGGIGGGGGNFSITPSNGVSTTRSIGLNYSNNLGKKVTVSGSYFFNSSDNNTISDSHTSYLDTLSSRGYMFSTSSSNSHSKNYNHRFNMRLEYNIDSLNSMVITPRFSYQENNSGSSSFSSNNQKDGSLYNSTISDNTSNNSGYNFSNELVFRHRFYKAGRTFSVGINTSLNDKISNGQKESEITKLIKGQQVVSPRNQRNPGNTNGLGLSGNVSYTEPLSLNSILQFNWNTSYSKNSQDRKVFGLDANMQDTSIRPVDSLSNKYDNEYVTNRGGIGYRFRTANMNLSFGVDYQRADLSGNQEIPKRPKVDKSFDDFLPNFMLNYKFSTKSNMHVMYRSSTNAPSISQLQDVVDNSNELYLSKGNPDLKQELSHNVMGRFSFANPDKSTYYFIMLSGGVTQNNIGNRTYYGKAGLFVDGVKVDNGVQLTKPVNLDHSYTARAMGTYSFLVKPIKSNLSLVGGFGYTQTPGYVDSILNRSNSYNISTGISLNSNISENFDFTLSYNTNYNLVRNSERSGMNNDYWTNYATFRLNWIFWKGIVLQNTMTGTMNRGLTSAYNQSYLQWNVSLGKKFLKNNAAELKVSAFDILNQNNNISRSVTTDYIRDSRTNAFRQYYLVTFTYNLRNFGGSMGQQGQRRDGMPWGGGGGGRGGFGRPGGDF